MLNAEVHDAIPSGSCPSWNNTKDREKRVIGAMSPESTEKKKFRSSRVILWTETIHSPQVVSIQDLLMKNPPICRTMCSAAAFPSQSAQIKHYKDTHVSRHSTMSPWTPPSRSRCWTVLRLPRYIHLSLWHKSAKIRSPAWNSATGNTSW